jgi:hypothetical protein
MRRSSTRGLLLSVLVLLALPSPGQAEHLMNVPPEMRLVRGSPDQGEASFNAVVARVSPDILPDAVQEEIKTRLLIATGDVKQMSNLVVYSWDAPWFHDQSLPPNYLIDFTSITPPESRASSLADPPCNDEGCLLAGYTFTTGKVWRQDFDMRATKVVFVPVPISRTNKDYRMEIRTLSNKDDCQLDGAETGQGCLRRFIWRKFGLSVIPPSQ